MRQTSADTATKVAMTHGIAPLIQQPAARQMDQVSRRAGIRLQSRVGASGIFRPVPPATEPGFLESRLPGGTLDELQLGCAAMARATQGAQVDCRSPGGEQSVSQHHTSAQPPVHLAMT
jgi:hypothetical protein